MHACMYVCLSVCLSVCMYVCLRVCITSTQSNNRCRQVPCLPHKAKVDVTKCHACHTKWRQMSRSATPATQNAAASRRHGWPSAPPEPTQCHKCHIVPRLPRKVTIHIIKCHACHTKRRWIERRCHKVPRLPQKVKADVTKCHACHAKRRGVTAPWLTKRAARAN